MITQLTFEIADIRTEALPAASLPETPAKGRDLCFGIILDPAEGRAVHDYKLTICIDPGDTLDIEIVVGARQSTSANLTLHVRYDRRGKESSMSVPILIDNPGGLERWYRPGIALLLYEFLEAGTPREIGAATKMRPTELARWLYRENRPVNEEYLRSYGPGMAYFFDKGKGPYLPADDGATSQLDHTDEPLFYVVVGPFYAVRSLTADEMMTLIQDPRLEPPLANERPRSLLRAANQYGAACVAHRGGGVSLTQVLPGSCLTAINTEMFTEAGAPRPIDHLLKKNSTLIPWGTINEQAVRTVNQFLEVLAETGIHAPFFVRAGLIHVDGLSLAHVPDNGIFEGKVVLRGPLRRDEHLFVDFLDSTDPYETGHHILEPWMNSIAESAGAGRLPRIISPE